MQKAFIYCRVSTEEQVEKGHSLETQEKYCRQFAKNNNYKVMAVFRDEGKSGTSLDRPALKDLLSRVQEDKSINAVIIQETDRLARNTKDHLTIRALLQKAEVKLISVAQPMLDDSPEGKMIDTIIASVNQFQSDINGRKTKKGMQERFDSGWWPGWAPLGYLNKVNSQQKVVVPDPKKWRLVKEAFKMYATGNYSAIEISDLLYEKGLRSQTGKKVCNSIMTKILRNPFYTGIMKWNKQEKVGKHKPMITLAEHKRILQIIDAHNLHTCRRRKYNFILRGFVFCNLCGARYTAEKHPAKNNVSYYHCAFNGKRGKNKPHNNNGQNVEVKDLEYQVQEQFRHIQFSDDFIERVIRKVKRLYDRQKEVIDVQKKVLLNQKLGLERKRDIAEDKLLSGTISDEDFGRIKERLTQDLDQIQDQWDEWENQRTLDVDIIREVLKLTRNIYRTYKTAPYELKRHFLGLFWEKFMVQDKSIVRAVPNRLIQTLIKNKQVILSDNLCPNPKLLIIFQDWDYMLTIKEKMREIKRLRKDLGLSSV